MVTHPFGSHAQPCLTFVSWEDHSHSAPPTLPSLSLTISLLVFLPPCLSVCLSACLSCLTESRFPVAARWFSDRKEKKGEDLSAELQMLQSMDREAQHMQDMLHYPEPQDIDKTGKQCGESLLCLSNRNGHSRSVDSSATVVHCVCVSLPLAPLGLSIRNNHSHSVDSSATDVHCVCVSLPLAPLCGH